MLFPVLRGHGSFESRVLRGSAWTVGLVKEEDNSGRERCTCGAFPAFFVGVSVMWDPAISFSERP